MYFSAAAMVFSQVELKISVPGSDESQLMWSPDSKKVACVAKSGPKAALYTVEVPDGGAKILPANRMMEAGGKEVDDPHPPPITRMVWDELSDLKAEMVDAVELLTEVFDELPHNEHPRADEVRAHYEWVASRRGCSISFAYAPDWELGNGASARAARTQVPSSPFLLMMADHLISPALIRRALAGEDLSAE